MRVHFGDEVRCMVTGYQGIAVARTEKLHSEDQIGIQPPVDKDGDIPEPQGIDETLLKVITKKKVEITPKKTQEIEVAVGDECYDPVTDFRGTVVTVTWFINGCAQVGVRGKIDKDGKPTKIEFFEGPRVKKVKAKAAETTPREHRTGGMNSPVPKQELG